MAFTPFYLVAYAVGLANDREMAKTCAIVVASFAAIAALFFTESGNAAVSGLLHGMMDFILLPTLAALGQLLR